MSFSTDGGYDDLDDAPTIRRPISVAQLLEREGYRPASRSRTTRRALTGVAAGAVLALGAVVGSLLLNHATGNSAGNTLASGSAGSADIVLSNQQPAATQNQQPAARDQQQIGTAAIAASTQPQGVRTGTTHRAATNPAQQQQQSTAPAAPTTTQSTQSAPVSTSTTSTAPTGTSSSAATPPSSASTPTSQQQAPTDATSSTTNSNNSSNGGLLGAVTGTVTGTLNSVTQPVFNWFG